MNKSRTFKEEELLKWENTANLKGWEKTKEYFTKIWINHEAFKRQQKGAGAKGHMRNSCQGAHVTTGELTPSQRSI